jgi:hypothetical protein
MVRNEVEVVQATRPRLGPVGVWLFALSPASIGQERRAFRQVEELGYGSILDRRGSRGRLDGRASRPSTARHELSHAGYQATTPPSYIVASTGWVPPVTVSSPSRRGSLHAAQTVTG